MRVVPALALLLGSIPGSALAQAYQCRMPQASVSVPLVERDGPVRQRSVTGYTLAASWSPEFCRYRKDIAADARQCSGREGRFGMIAHGLWPEGRGSDWPQWCPNPRRPSGAELARNLCITPSARLLTHAWAKHGACMTNRPETYLRVSRILWNSLRWPDFDRLSRQPGLTAGDVRRAFADANRRFEPEHVGVRLNPRGWLEELRLCYGKDFLPTKCEARRFGPPDTAPVQIWRGL